MGIFKSIWRLFIPRERTLVFTSFKLEDYLKVKNRLVQSGIPHRSGIKNYDGNRGTFPTRRTQYSIYVAKEDEGSAVKASSC